MAARRENNQSPPFLTPFELDGVRADLRRSPAAHKSPHLKTPHTHWHCPHTARLLRERERALASRLTCYGEPSNDTLCVYAGCLGQRVDPCLCIGISVAARRLGPLRFSLQLFTARARTGKPNAADGPRPARPPRGRPFVVRPDLAANRAEAACRFDRAPLTTTICADNVFRACAAFVVLSATSSITAPSHSLRPAAEASRATNAITSTLSPCR